MSASHSRELVLESRKAIPQPTARSILRPRRHGRRETTRVVEGSCFCGEVRYEVDGPLNTMMSCHCSMCRKHHGSAFATYVSAPLDDFRWVHGEDSLLKYQSSAQGTRNSCGVCGST